MARQRRERESDKTQEANISRQDLPPSYEDTIKNGQAGGFVDPTTGGLPVKTIVQVIQVCYDGFQGRIIIIINYHWILQYFYFETQIPKYPLDLIVGHTMLRI